MTEVTVNGQKLKGFRDNLGWTQGQLEIQSGVSQAHISRLEKGQRKNAEINTVGRLADALGVEPRELLSSPISPGDLPPLRLFLQHKYGVDLKTAQQLTDIVETLVYGWQKRMEEDKTA